MPHRAASPAISENDFDITKSLFKDDENKLPSTIDTGEILDLGLESDGDDAFIAAHQAASNRKSSNIKGKSVRKGGGFQALGMRSPRLRRRFWLIFF